MKKPEIIDEKIAQEFIKDSHSLGFMPFIEAKEITDEAVKILAESEEYLGLTALTSLSDAAAESLSRHQGRLGLCGLTSLSDAAVESLSKHEGDLSLQGLTSLTDAAAESLSRHQGQLDLSGLKLLSDAAAESLAKHQGSLSLNGLTTLTDAAAESLSKHEGMLNLSVMKELSDSAVEVLSKKHVNYELYVYDCTSDGVLIGVANITDADREYEMRSGSDYETRDRFTGDYVRFQYPLEQQSQESLDINQAAKTGEEILFDFLLIEGEGGGGGAYFDWGMGSEELTDTEKDEIYESCLSDRLGILESYGYESND